LINKCLYLGGSKLNKTISILVVGLLVLAGLGAVVIAEENEENKYEKINLSFSKPTIKNEVNYAEIQLDQANSFIMEYNKPMIPCYGHTFKFPAGTDIKNVEVTFSQEKTIPLEKELSISPKPIQIKSLNRNDYVKEKTATELKKPYPENEYEYSIGRGLENGKPTIFVNVQANPIRYNPADKTITYIDNFDINIKYQEPSEQIKTNDKAYLLILTPSSFISDLNDLVIHKTNLGISTELVSLYEVYNGIHFPEEGRDDIEKIKYFIKNAYEEWGTRNVLIVGGEDQFPARKTHIRIVDEETGNDDIESFLSDLYYADLYNGENGFASWDTNKNDVFAEINWYGNNDELDCYPDVRIGRLACTDETQVQTVVNKIITYETNEAWTKNWFNDIVVIGGDTVPKSYGDNSGIDEGEYLNQAIIDTMEGFIPDKIWDSNGRLSGLFTTGVDYINNGINSGCGFVDFSGHGAPWIWTTFPHNGKRQSLPTPMGQYTDNHIEDLTNGEKLPIVMCGGCSLGKYAKKDNCFAWAFLSNPNGGGIASFGATALGYVYLGEWVTYGLVEGLALRIFEAYNDGSFSFGEMWTDAYNDYINTLDLDEVDYKTLAEWQPFGDPTLQLRSDSLPPKKPDKPIGPATGEPGENQIYTAVTTDPNEDKVYYLFDWGDGTQSKWLGPFESGQICETSHEWEEQGQYSIKVKAKDIHGVQSEWSDPLEVSMPKNKICGIPLIEKTILFLKEYFPGLIAFLT